MDIPKRRELGKRMTVIAVFALVFVFAATLFAAGTNLALGLSDPVMGGLTVMWVVAIFVVVLLVGAILWGTRTKGLKEVGMGATILSIIVLGILGLAAVITPAAISPGQPSENANFEIISVGDIGGATYSQASKTLTVSATVNLTTHVMSPTHIHANFTVERTDAGPSTDVRTVAATVSQSSRTDPSSGLTYKCIASNSFGVPNVDWTMYQGGSSVSATDTLSAQMGLTPYQTGSFNVTVNFNANAFSTSDVQASDVIYAATFTIGAEVYTLQVVMATVTP